MSAANPVVPTGVSKKGYFHVSPSTFQQNSADPDDQVNCLLAGSLSNNILMECRRVMQLKPLQVSDNKNLSFFICRKHL